MAKQQENYNKGGKFISDNDLRSKISIKYELNKERRSYKKTSDIKKLEIILICTDTLVRNLRLWSVKKCEYNESKAYTLKKERNIKVNL